MLRKRVVGKRTISCSSLATSTLLIGSLLVSVAAYKVCPKEKGGGICPDYNTCCATGTPGVSSCVSAKDGEEGACCVDDGLGVTGCKPDYECKSQNDDSNPRTSASADQGLYCHRIDPNYNGTNPEPVILPRYQLCTLPHIALTHAFGLPLYNETGNDARGEQKTSDNTVNVAYFSTMGSLDSSDSADLWNHQRVATVLIMVHGSGRTAGDYLYGAASSLPKAQQNPNNTTMMVIAPWFLDLEDDDLVLKENRSILLDDCNQEHVPIPLPPRTLRWIERGPVLPHTWRYGANAINSSLSSFAAIDRLVERLVSDSVRFPSLRRILVAGHSAGGQFVHRWALLSNSPAWKQAQQERKRLVKIRVIPANPRCFAFLDDRRFGKNKSVFERPEDEFVRRCPDYNEWIWGLEAGGGIDAPYKDKAIVDGGGAQCVSRRYVTERRVVYLAGGEDLEVQKDQCGSRIQGKTRRERSHQFFKSLLQVYPEEMNKSRKHDRLLVPGVPHDHALMFQSPEGQQALFGGDANEHHNNYGGVEEAS